MKALWPCTGIVSGGCSFAITMAVFLLSRESLALETQSAVLGESPPQNAIVMEAISPDCRHVAVVSKSDSGKQVLAVDGHAVATEDDFRGVAFSSDGAHMAYVKVEPKGSCVVLDGKPGEIYDSIPNGIRLNGKSYSALYFSPNDRHLAYLAAKGKGIFAVVDGVAGAPYSAASDISFSDDGEHWLLVGTKLRPPRVMCCISDGKEGPESVNVSCAQFAPGSAKPSYFADDGRGTDWVVRNGVEGKHVEQLLQDHTLTFSPDGKHCVYFTQLDTSTDDPTVTLCHLNLVVDETSTTISTQRLFAEEFPFIDQVALGADGRHVAYIATRGQKSSGRRGDPPPPPDMFLVGYPPMIHGFSQVVVDGKAGATYDMLGKMQMSPDEQHLAYPAVMRNKWHIVVDGKEGQAFDRITTARFSPDSQHIVFAALRGGAWRVILDGKEVENWELVVPEIEATPIGNGPDWTPPFRFDKDGSLAFLARKSGMLARVLVK